MISRYLIATMILSVTGCDQTPTEQAQNYIASWSEMGAQLPSDQVEFFAGHWESVGHLVADALEHPEQNVRTRAAYTIEEVGPTARSLETQLGERIDREPDRLVRIYLYGALRGIEAQARETTEVLRQRWDELADAPLAPPEDLLSHTSAVQERIAVAAALHALDEEEDRRPVYAAFMLQWLEPPSDNLADEAQAWYWEYRLDTVTTVEHLPEMAEEALPLLRAMLEEETAPAWVAVHVPRAIESLESGESGD